MAKKTNKTNHVLNLLSGAEEQETESKIDASKEKNESNIQIVSQNEEDVVAANVEQMLEAELLQEESMIKEHNVDAVADTKAEMEEELEVESVSGDENDACEMNVMNEELQIQAAVAETDENEESTEQAEADETAGEAAEAFEAEELEAAEENGDKAEAETEANANAEAKADAEKESDNAKVTARIENTGSDEEEKFILVNVMEKLIDDKLDYYMKKFGVCNCPRCRVDVKALALTQMEPKYVVVDKSGVSAFLSLYTNKYSGAVMFYLGNACMQVIKSPRH